MSIGFTELCIRLLVASLLGAVIGFERESASRGAGARTLALVALGAALFTTAGAYGFADVDQGRTVDPARVAAQVATGVGFIGGGVILRDGASVLGVTTAAAVWLAAAVGVMTAAGGGAAAAVATVVSLGILLGLRMVQSVVARRGPDREGPASGGSGDP